MTYQICGAVFVSASGVQRRCYARGSSRYDGRCRACSGQTDTPRRGPRCGYRGPTFNRQPCHQPVHLEGDRCERHTAAGLRKSAAKRRAELADRIANLVRLRAKYDARIVALRAELGRMSELEAAE